MKKLLFIVTILLLVLSFSGCSWIFMDTAHNYSDPSKEPKCDGYTYPIIDGVVAISFGGMAAGVFGESHVGLGEMGLGAIAAGLAVLYALSSVSGFAWAHDCGEKQEVHQKWLAMPPGEQVKFKADWLKKHVRVSRPKPQAKSVISENQERTKQVIRRPAKPGSLKPSRDDIVDVNARDEWGWTPSGLTPLGVAVQLGKSEIADLLKKHGGLE